MMRPWFARTAKTIVVSSTVISVITHATLITGWVLGTLPIAGLPQSSIANKVFYIPPPDRAPPTAGSRERVRFVKQDLNGFATGDGPRTIGNDRPTAFDESIGHEIKAATDSVSADSSLAVPSEDSVYSILEVDSAVVRSSSSAAPIYPVALLAAHIQGFVNAQYVVDTTGRADTTTFHVMESTNPQFTDAVKNVLPLMLFQPAKIGQTKVRQLVQQSFAFKITDTVKVDPKKKRP